LEVEPIQSLILTHKGWSTVVTVEVRESEDVNSALRRFKHKCVREAIFQDIRKYAYYDKPSVRKRKKHLKAIKRMRRSMRREG